MRPGQPNACPVRDEPEWTRSAITPSVPQLHALRPFLTPLERAYNEYGSSLTYISDDVVLVWHPLLAFSQWTQSQFIVDFVGYNCAEQFMVASKARLFSGDTALSALFASNDPREQKRLGRQVRHFSPALWQDECQAIVLRGNLANFSQNE